MYIARNLSFFSVFSLLCIVINMKSFHFILGYFSNAFEFIIFFFEISIASAMVFQTTFIFSFGNHSALRVDL